MGERTDRHDPRFRRERVPELPEQREVAEHVGAEHQVETVSRARVGICGLDSGIADDGVEAFVHGGRGI